MEIGQSESAPSSPVIEHASRSTWTKVTDALTKIPIAEKYADNIAAFTKQLDAPSLQNVRHALEKHGKTFATLGAVAANTVDVTLAEVCGAVSVGKVRDLGFRTGDRRAAEAITHSHPRLIERTVRPYVLKTKSNAIGFGALSGAILLVRPVSRLALFGGIATKPVSERIGQIVNRIAGGGRDAT